MSVGLLVIAHAQLGNALVETAIGTLENCPLEVRVLGIPRDGDPEELGHQAEGIIHEIDRGDGVLVLTDMYGSTPGNIACRLLHEPRVNVVAGINLPMIIRVFNYACLDLEALTEKAISGGRDGVVFCPGTPQGKLQHA